MDEYWDNIFKMRSCLGYPSEERVELWKKVILNILRVKRGKRII